MAANVCVVTLLKDSDGGQESSLRGQRRGTMAKANICTGTTPKDDG